MLGGRFIGNQLWKKYGIVIIPFTLPIQSNLASFSVVINVSQVNVM